MASSPALRTFARRWMKPLTLIALLAPFLWLVIQIIMLISGRPNDLGINPAETIHHFLGDTAIRILLVTLAITPIRDLTGWAPIILIRRRIGLAAFYYAALHIVAYLWLDLLWSLEALWEDVLERTYITLGMAAFVLLIPLAVTSTNGMIRRLGRSRWQKIHYLIYPVAILAVLHHTLVTKSTQWGEIIHGVALAILLLWRLPRWISPLVRTST